LYSTFYRQYDPRIGRFSGVDILSEKTTGMSVYQFAINNPISYNDPTGAKFKDQNGNVWHHADPFADISGLAGTAYVDGWGDDGFGGSGGGGGGGVGGGVGGSGDYSAFWNNLWNNAPEGKNTTYGNNNPLDDPTHPYGYISENNLGAYNSKTDHGDTYDDPEMDEKFFLTSFKGLDLSPSMFSWDGSIMRAITPDFVSIGVGFNGIAGVGGGSSIEFQWVLHGPEASWKPALTATQSIGVGYSVDATINVGTSRYSGSASDIRRKMLFTNSLSNGDAPTIWGSGGAEILGKVGFTGTFTPLNDGYIYGTQGNFGLGLIGPNFAGGISNTWLLNDWAK
jgi:hypothetical protein